MSLTEQTPLPEVHFSTLGFLTFWDEKMEAYTRLGTFTQDSYDSMRQTGIAIQQKLRNSSVLTVEKARELIGSDLLRRKGPRGYVGTMLSDFEKLLNADRAVEAPVHDGNLDTAYDIDVSGLADTKTTDEIRAALGTTLQSGEDHPQT